MTPELDLLHFPQYLVTPGERVIARRVESQRATAAHARARHRRYLADPLVRQRNGQP